MGTPTREDRDLAVAALRHAAATGRPASAHAPIRADGRVCSCVIIAEALGDIPLPKPRFTTFTAATNSGEKEFYEALIDRGFTPYRIYATNDEFLTGDIGLLGARDDDNPEVFNVVADLLEGWDVVEAAERIARDAVTVDA